MQQRQFQQCPHSNQTVQLCFNSRQTWAYANIYELGFVLTEVNLYLDTHPDDLEAIEYYAQIKDKYCDYMTQYADYYGPLDKLHISNDNYWMWVATPMPWEMEGC